MSARKWKGGAPTKVPGGLRRAIYVRCDDELIRLVDEALALRRTLRPSMSRADVVREILHQTLRRDARKHADKIMRYVELCILAAPGYKPTGDERATIERMILEALG